MKPAPEAGSEGTARGAAGGGEPASRPGRDTPDERRASADSRGVSRNRTDPPPGRGLQSTWDRRREPEICRGKFLDTPWNRHYIAVTTASFGDADPFYET